MEVPVRKLLYEFKFDITGGKIAILKSTKVMSVEVDIITCFKSSLQSYVPPWFEKRKTIFMSIKDLDLSGDKGGSKEEAKDEKDSKDVVDAKVKGVGETEVKNAHASGDGSFGRSDESLPDGEGKEEKVDNTY